MLLPTSHKLFQNSLNLTSRFCSSIDLSSPLQKRSHDDQNTMGLLSYLGLSSGTPAPKDPTAPDRTERQKCWAARDAFFECLDANGIIDSIRDSAPASKACSSQLKVFERDCAASWVEYFKKRRVQEHKKATMMKQLEAEGGQQLTPEVVMTKK